MPIQRAHGDTIRLSGIRVDAVVGVYAHERTRAQPLVIDVEAGISTELAGRTEQLAHTLDYASLAAEVAFVARHGAFELLETAALALLRVVLLRPEQPWGAAEGGRPALRSPSVEWARVRLTKPEALGGRAEARVEVTRDRAWAGAAERETKPFGTVDVLAELPNVGVYRLNIAPGRGIPLHVHRRMREAELVLTRGLLCQGRAVRPGTVFVWPHDHPHRYDNPTDAVQSVLCLDAPKFDPADEVEVMGEPKDLTPDVSLVWGEP